MLRDVKVYEPDKLRLHPADYERAAKTLGCEVAAIRAVADVEGGRWGAFLETGEPVILFERHKFSLFTGGKWVLSKGKKLYIPGRFDAVAPDLSNPKPGGYGSVFEQHGRLQRAAALDREAALKSASWGQFQIMGFNHKIAGHPSLQGFINAMYRSAGDHLDAFVAFLVAAKLDGPLRQQDWRAFARGYNGERYAEHGYHLRLASAYKKHALA